jgi:hypothetical protein
MKRLVEGTDRGAPYNRGRREEFTSALCSRRLNPCLGLIEINLPPTHCGVSRTCG